ncbi:hypothetical protein G3A_06185 [Bacillus sp. 17376]|nr:hypothetical protein G3A_06185 [Bacillus sp. 17376]
MADFNVVSIIYLGLVVALIVLFAFSFTLFIRRMLINSSQKRNQTVEIEKKLDKVIELLDKHSNKK